ncbi:MAG TPA: PGPGW domain-containing protein [Planctomycetota bacterium]
MIRAEVNWPLLAPLQAAEGSLWEWWQSHSDLLWWLFLFSLGSLVLTALLLPVFVLRLPADYFLASRSDLAARCGVVYWIGRAAKNVLGLVFAIAGLVMIVLPGQGVLTLLIGLLLLDFPGKRALERRFVARPKVLAFLNRIRARRGREPLRVE